MADADCDQPAGPPGPSVLNDGGKNDSATAATPIEMLKPDALPFRFFDLARETRDQIYGLCANDKKAEDVNDRWYFASSTTCATNLLLVSREFREEYEQGVYRDAEACLSISVGIELEGLYRSPLPTERLRFCSRIKHLTLELDGWVHGLGKDPRL
ncbi:hypothetical protein EJ03DRAFT_33112 [Teratosphaeria nubilosa]|uniref:Uncharacterized protein n=1 Tax=Teratosphaeria nubilosa TaxID=161662 RepID=A0A6G1KUL0_9PEZI|nr:hypothetical protein EJ03DRAFT_33112 [Teratosphaeria nubilosa]